MKTYRTRYNFATNSSSSHSIVRIPDETDPASFRDNLVFDDNYGWGPFTLVSLEEKLRYVATQFNFVLRDEDLLLWSTLPQPLSGGVDHQSNDMFCGHTLAKAIEIVSDPRVIILGGNDNGGWHPLDDYPSAL